MVVETSREYGCPRLPTALNRSTGRPKPTNADAPNHHLPRGKGGRALAMAGMMMITIDYY